MRALSWLAWHWKRLQAEITHPLPPEPGPSYIAPRDSRPAPVALPQLDDQFEEIEDEDFDPEALEAPVAPPFTLLPDQPRAYRTEKGWRLGYDPLRGDEK